MRGEGGLAETTWNAALAVAAQLIADGAKAAGPAGIALLGGARGTNEDAYAWAAARRRDRHRPPRRPARRRAPAALLDLPRATIDEAAAATTIVLLGPDLKEELPVLYLRLRDAAEQRAAASSSSPGGDRAHPYAWRSVASSPAPSAAVARPRSPTRDPRSARRRAGGHRRRSGQPGRVGGVADGALRAVLDACPDAKVLPALRRGNVVGALQLGLAPPADGGLDGLGILDAAAAGHIDCSCCSAPIRSPTSPTPTRPPDDRRRRRVIAVDTFLTESSSPADVVLAAAAFGEKSGTTTNLEGRVTTVTQKVTPPARPGPTG